MQCETSSNTLYGDRHSGESLLLAVLSAILSVTHTRSWPPKKAAVGRKCFLVRWFGGETDTCRSLAQPAILHDPNVRELLHEVCREKDDKPWRNVRRNLLGPSSPLTWRQY